MLKKILVVDDDSSDINLIRKSLREGGYSSKLYLDTFKDREIISLMKNKEIDYAILDLSIGGNISFEGMMFYLQMYKIPALILSNAYLAETDGFFPNAPKLWKADFGKNPSILINNLNDYFKLKE